MKRKKKNGLNKGVLLEFQVPLSIGILSLELSAATPQQSASGAYLYML